MKPSIACCACMVRHEKITASYISACCKYWMDCLMGKELPQHPQLHMKGSSMPVCMQVQPVFGNPIVHSSAGAIMARFNISKDAIYFPAGKRKGDKAGGGSRLHTAQAVNFTSIPLRVGTRAEMFHRPMGLWNPLFSRKIHVKNQNKLQSKLAWLCTKFTTGHVQIQAGLTLTSRGM